MSRILVVSQYFYPESFKSNDIAFELQRRGYEVDVLTSIPNYPQGEYYPDYGVFRRRREKINGVNVYRAFQFPRGHKSGVRLILNYASYACCASVVALWLAVVKKKYDAIIVHATSPIFQALPAMLLKKLRGIPVYTWVLDIWPDAIRSAGHIRNTRIIGLVNRFVQWVYRNSCKVLISSKDFRALVNRDYDYGDKVVYFPNWCEDVSCMPKVGTLPLPDGFLVMMAGNLGTAQDIRNVMQAVLLTRHISEIKWCFVGDGSERPYIERFMKQHGLQDTVVLTGKVPFEQIPSLYARANVMLLTLRAAFPHLEAVVPARLQSYMAAGRPVAGMVSGGSADMIAESGCGRCVPAGDYKALAACVLDFYKNPAESVRMGQNAYQYYIHNFTKEHCISNLEQIIH